MRHILHESAAAGQGEAARSDVCIVTFYDDAFSIIGDLAFDSMRRLAEAQGYGCIRFEKRGTDRPPSWEKISCIRKAFDLGYRFALWIDADAIVVDLARDIRSVVDRGGDEAGAGKDFFLVRHDIAGSQSPNLGVLLVRNSESSMRILDGIFDMEKYAEHRWWEQAAFMEYFGLIGSLSGDEQALFDGYESEDGVPARDIPARASAERHIEWIGEEWNFIPHISDSERPKSGPAARPIIMHYAGQPWFRRQEGMIRESMRCGYLRLADGWRYARYGLVFIRARIRTLLSVLWLGSRRFFRARCG